MQPERPSDREEIRDYQGYLPKTGLPQLAQHWRAEPKAQTFYSEVARGS
jgi:hypothetical protein